MIRGVGGYGSDELMNVLEWRIELAKLNIYLHPGGDDGITCT
jgi:hypothetical protein